MNSYEVRIKATAKRQGISKYRNHYYRGIVVTEKREKKESIGEKVRLWIHADLQDKNMDKEIETRVVSVNRLGGDFIFTLDK